MKEKKKKNKQRKERNILILTVLGGRWSTTGFCDCGSKGVKKKKEAQNKLTLITFSNFSGPLTPLIESL